MLVHISSEEPNGAEYNFDQAASVWASKRNRKIYICPFLIYVFHFLLILMSYE